MAGAHGVCDMLVQRRVAILLFEERHEFADPAAIEWMVEEAIEQSAEILAVRRDPDGLAVPGQSQPSCASETDQLRHPLLLSAETEPAARLTEAQA